MQVLLLGTGGADGIPALYGRDRVSEYARTHGGRDVRSRSSALIDGHLKIDLGPDTHWQMVQSGARAADWSGLFFTHSDDDHLCLSEIQYALFPFVHNEALPFPIYANATVCRLISSKYPHWPVELHEQTAYQTFLHQDYAVTPVHATHKEDEVCFNFLFERNGKKLLYATDTGVYREEVFSFLAGRQIDALVIEASDGNHKTPYIGHMDLAQCIEVVSRLRESGALCDDCQVVTTHHTGAGDVTHDELGEILAPYRIQPGYDGMLLNL